jgi:hypothetical protein
MGRNTGSWCLIADLSFPPGRSVNDGIIPHVCYLDYALVDRPGQQLQWVRVQCWLRYIMEYESTIGTSETIVYIYNDSITTFAASGNS